MKKATLLLAAVALFSCAGQGQQQKTERPKTPQCLSLCSNQFAACTEEYPGDFSACRADRTDCEEACNEQKALERMEADDDKEVMVPTDAEDDGLSGDDELEPTPELDDSE